MKDQQFNKFRVNIFETKQISFISSLIAAIFQSHNCGMFLHDCCQLQPEISISSIIYVIATDHFDIFKYPIVFGVTIVYLPP